MPENEMHTTAYWLTLPRALMARLALRGRRAAGRRGGAGLHPGPAGRAVPACATGTTSGWPWATTARARPRIERGLRAAGTALPSARGRGDDYEPQIFIYDNYPGGIGLSEPLYRLHDRLLRGERGAHRRLRLPDGCPSCVGPVGEVGSRGKEVALAILEPGGSRRGEVVLTGRKRRPIAETMSRFRPRALSCVPLSRSCLARLP